MAQQSWLTHLIAAKVHALHGQPSAAWGLVGLGLAYGVVHAAGPGHGKAVLASYMLANETSLKRGAVMALMAALLQARDRDRARRRGRVRLQRHRFGDEPRRRLDRPRELLQHRRHWRVAGLAQGRSADRGVARHADRRRAVAAAPAYAGVAWGRPAFSLSAAAYRAGPPGAAEGPAEATMRVAMSMRFDPARLDGSFSWRDAAGTVIAAGARPCSGAILVLVFAMAQGLFAAGVAAAFAMAIGTAVTTGALAWTAVFAKSTAMRLAAGENSRLALVAKGFEFAAALAVLAFGLALLVGARGGA